jgi:hypothetical protein
MNITVEYYVNTVLVLNTGKFRVKNISAKDITSDLKMRLTLLLANQLMSVIHLITEENNKTNLTEERLNWETVVVIEYFITCNLF